MHILAMTKLTKSVKNEQHGIRPCMCTIKCKNSLLVLFHEMLCTVMYKTKITKMENSFLVTFHEIWPKTLIVKGLWPDFGATLKICKKSNFD